MQLQIFGLSPRVKTFVDPLVRPLMGEKFEDLYQRLTTDLPKELERAIQSARERELTRESVPAWNVVGRAEAMRDRAFLKLERWIHIPTEAQAAPADEPGLPPAYQVRPQEDGWIIVMSGSSTPIETFAKKPQAIKAAKNMAKQQKGSLDVFTKSGSLQESITFS